MGLRVGAFVIERVAVGEVKALTIATTLRAGMITTATLKTPTTNRIPAKNNLRQHILFSRHFRGAEYRIYIYT